MKVTLRLYRQEIDWELTESQEKEAIEMIRILPGTLMKYESSLFDYKGIRVDTYPNEVIFLYNGLVQICSCGVFRTFMDYDRELEEWFFQTSGNKLETAIYNRISMSQFSDASS